MPEGSDQQPWYSVRCVFQLPTDDDGYAYEERITIWKATDFDEAIALAETEAAEYVTGMDMTYIGLAQSFHLFGEPSVGQETFSLIRESDLPPDEYLDTFFDTGREFQSHIRNQE
jgi:hypothetical protein